MLSHRKTKKKLMSLCTMANHYIDFSLAVNLQMNKYAHGLLQQLITQGHRVSLENYQIYLSRLKCILASNVQSHFVLTHLTYMIELRCFSEFQHIASKRTAHQSWIELRGPRHFKLHKFSRKKEGPSTYRMYPISKKANASFP